MTVDEALEGVSKLFLDTAPVIYHLEGHLRYSARMARLMQARAERGIILVTSPVTLAECLIRPLRLRRHDLSEAYLTALTVADGMELHALDIGEGIEAARIRAAYDLPLADALQVAAALGASCEALLTNDAVFRRLRCPRPLLLDDLDP